MDYFSFGVTPNFQPKVPHLSEVVFATSDLAQVTVSLHITCEALRATQIDHKVDIETLKSQITDLKTVVENLKDQIQDIKQQLSKLQEKQKSQGDAKDVADGKEGDAQEFHGWVAV